MILRACGGAYLTPVPFLLARPRSPLALLGIANPPTPILFGPLYGLYSNGATAMRVATNENDATIYATLSDSPPTGVASALALTGATVQFVLSTMTVNPSVVLSNAGRIVSATANTVAYDLSSTDLSSLTPGTIYRWSFVVTFPSGQKREFGHGILYLYGPNQQ